VILYLNVKTIWICGKFTRKQFLFHIFILSLVLKKEYVLRGRLIL